MSNLNESVDPVAKVGVDKKSVTSDSTSSRVSPTETDAHLGPTNLLSEYLASAYDGSVGRSVDSLKQLAGIQPVVVQPQEHLSGVMKVANVLGTASGQILEFLILNKLAGKAASNLVEASGEASVVAKVLAEGSISRAITTSATVGFLNGAVLTPLQDGETSYRRLGNGLVDAASFAALGCVGAKLAGKYGVGPVGIAKVNALSGVAGGATNALLDPISHDRAPEITQVATTAAVWGIGGAVAGEVMRSGAKFSLTAKPVGQIGGNGNIESKADAAPKIEPAIEPSPASLSKTTVETTPDTAPVNLGEASGGGGASRQASTEDSSPPTPHLEQGSDAFGGKTGRSTHSMDSSAVAHGMTLIDVADVPHENPEVVKAQGYQSDSAANAPWKKSMPMRQRFVSLQGKSEADVVVVGGGVVGLQTAHELGSNGIKTVLLEKGLVGSGTSSFMGAMGTYAEDPGFKAILDAHGEDGFKRRLQELITSRASVQQLARRYGADWQKVNSYNVSYEEGDPALQAEVDLLHRFNDMQPQFVTGDAASRIFAPARSAVIFPDEGNLNPYKFSIGLANSGKFAVHEHSPVLGIAVGAQGDGVDVFSPTGTIHARRVVLATNAPAPMFSFLNSNLEPVQCFATTADIGQHLPGNFFDTDPGAFTYWRQFRVKQYGPTETLIGGTARFLNENTAEPDSPRLTARVSSLFNGAQARDPISALIFTAYSDGLPVASPHPQYPDVWTATGAGGTGLVNGNLMARTIRTQFRTPWEENLLSATRFGN